MLGTILRHAHGRLDDEAGRLAALDRYRLRGEPDGSVAGFQQITDLVAELLDAPICTISVITDDVQYFAGATGAERGFTPRSVAICDHTIRNRSDLRIADLTLDQRFAAAPFVRDERHFRSYAGVPLTTPDGYNLGALCVIDRRPREFTDDQVALLDKFAALVVEQIELRTLADHDYLTGALSRRGFCEKAGAVLRRVQAGDPPATLVAIDVDHFKSINDRFGHGCGDDVLRALVKAVSDSLRPGDFIGRIGGEEFALLLPNCDDREAQAIAERHRVAIGVMQNPSLPMVTASMGVATSADSATFEQWLERADHALYEAKRGGRNRTMVYSDRSEAA